MPDFSLCATKSGELFGANCHFTAQNDWFCNAKRPILSRKTTRFERQNASFCDVK